MFIYVLNLKFKYHLNHEEVMEYTNGEGVDVVLDTLGPDTLNT
ncbi:hypothetical protein J5U22_01759 [Saccharolobus shibatae]|uniref:Uncharacterized protein n=1 Tax=Saccharolobus shibatae TaxID=2286 RepID=A0A8F5C135_9CREN|nr:hypothetical protein J5U22_01759 [Saccharolobus shibatae]